MKPAKMKPAKTTGPVDGETVLFCQHASVDDDHIDISAEACEDQPFHWYLSSTTTIES